uniref:Uncharacterized protein n=1 Tax=Megaviridae environmental sample TaxID=1737588 RepID=A0A5J6VH54_9VIRU|nr:MAG: hypothetical protein [Megaviridae environmental sample]
MENNPLLNKLGCKYNPDVQKNYEKHVNDRNMLRVSKGKQPQFNIDTYVDKSLNTSLNEFKRDSKNLDNECANIFSQHNRHHHETQFNARHHEINNISQQNHKNDDILMTERKRFYNDMQVKITSQRQAIEQMMQDMQIN